MTSDLPRSRVCRSSEEILNTHEAWKAAMVEEGWKWPAQTEIDANHCDAGLICETHPDLPWPQDDCPGPGQRCSQPDRPWWRGPARAALIPRTGPRS